MMTAVLFTAVAPKPVLAGCAHPHPPKTKTVEEYVQTITHTVNGQVCTMKSYNIYQIAYCGDCNTVFNKTFLRQDHRHSVTH